MTDTEYFLQEKIHSISITYLELQSSQDKGSTSTTDLNL